MSADIPGVPLEILPFLKQRPELSIFGTKTPKPQPPPSVHFRCDMCSFETNILQHYQNHLLEHKSQKEFLCPICGKSYKSEKRLQMHVESHEAIYPHVCIYCEKKFKSQASLNNHLKSHFPEDISCHVCNKPFKSKVSLRRHFMSVHSNENYPK